MPNTYDLTGRTVLVTGGAQGLGRAIAELALASGARVCIADIQGAEKTAEALGATGVALDVTDPASVQAGVAVAVAALGRIDVLVNNAGISGLGDPKLFLDTEPAEWNAIMGVNLTGPYLMTRAVAPAMVERGEGVVVNIASVAGVVPLRGRGPYSVSKAALVQLTRAMAAEYAAAGIRVTAIGPGAMDTPFIRWRLEDPELGPAMLAKIPVGRVVSPEEIAEMVVFLASPGAAYINGAHLLADGAMSCTL
ncbi:MAG TPA: SDR family NAD(P)-dependent oxidoreductase [Sporichthyaceae bacterium]|nr:SDR family NAD(P)-dependent oxidoreductase [Sporichthyaceae bacterium]